MLALVALVASGCISDRVLVVSNASGQTVYERDTAGVTEVPAHKTGETDTWDWDGRRPYQLLDGECQLVADLSPGPGDQVTFTWHINPPLDITARVVSGSTWAGYMLNGVAKCGGKVSY